METEYEATFWPIDKEHIRQKLSSVGAHMEYQERVMRRVVFHLPMGAPLTHGWARVRDEGDKVTMSIKQSGSALEQQKELEIVVSDFDSGIEILRSVGCIERAYQETKRELWMLDGVAITLDEWPFLEPFIEIEGVSEEVIRHASEKLGFPWQEALFCSADTLYVKKYGISLDRINKETPRLVFADLNPFETQSGK
jgi:adenylate cyclase, class 2